MGLGRVPDDPSCNRLIIDEWEWVMVKEAIDIAREDPSDEESQKILQAHDLWDYFNGCPDNSKINFLYMRNS